MRIARIFEKRQLPVFTPHPSLASNTAIGVEIELERCERYPELPGWRVIGDGSLRENGVEFVFNGPAGGESAVERLEAFRNHVSRKRKPYFCSERTSIHVHMNVLDLEVSQLKQLLRLYLLMEPYIFSLCGEGRADNIYSLAVYEGLEQINALSLLLETNNLARYHHLLHDGALTKYSGMNLTCLHSFGTLEFRGHEGTTDTDRIYLLINTLLRLKEAVVTDNICAEDLLDLVHIEEPDAIFTRVFGDYYTPQENQEESELLYLGATTLKTLLHRSDYDHAQAKVFDKLRAANAAGG